ncbi:hypothetical protein GW17_00030647 [Ensete ventricosum]|nr:hypothetical protein GW17_00030647 [Ensete ventricosum]
MAIEEQTNDGIWERLPLLWSAISGDIDRGSTGRRRRIVPIAGVSLVESIHGFLEVGLETHLEGEVAERYGSTTRPALITFCCARPPPLPISKAHCVTASRMPPIFHLHGSIKPRTRRLLFRHLSSLVADFPPHLDPAQGEGETSPTTIRSCTELQFRASGH